MDFLGSFTPGGWDFMVRHEIEHLSYIQKGPEAFKIPERSLTRILITTHMSTLMILFTFGIMAPLLGFVMIVAIGIDTIAGQMVVGRFIVMQCNVLLSVKSKNSLEVEKESAKVDGDTGGQSNPQLPEIHLTAALEEAIAELDEPWGAVSIIHRVEEVYDMIPSKGLITIGRRKYLIVCSFVFASYINDIYNSTPTPHKSIVAQMFLLAFIPIIEIVAGVYHTQVTKRRQKKERLTLASLYDSRDTITTAAAENNISASSINTNPIHKSVISSVGSVITGSAGSGIVVSNGRIGTHAVVSSPAALSKVSADGKGKVADRKPKYEDFEL